MKKIIFLVLTFIACSLYANAQDTSRVKSPPKCKECRKYINVGNDRCQHNGKHPICEDHNCKKIIDKGHVVVNRCKYDGTHPPYMNVDSKEIIVNGKKWESTIEVTSNVKWSAEASHSWISISKQNGSLAYTLHRNPQNTTREGYIDIYTTDRSKSVRIRVVQLKNMGIEVKNIQFANWKDSLLTRYGDTLYAQDIFWLFAWLNYKSLMTKCDTDDTLFVKIIRPDGTLVSSESSPTGYTFFVNSVSFHNHETSNGYWCRLSGCGSESGGSYFPGTYTYEIWYHDGLVYSTKFTLYDKKATSGGVRMDGNTLIFSVEGTEYRYEMVYVSGGTFKMGAQKEDPYSDNYDPDAFSDENPVHNVTVSSFYIGQTEVTQALWKAVMGNNPSEWKGNNLPVENVSYNDCMDFILKLKQLTGRTFRLPTEAEWEYAARGGNKSMGYKYAGGNILGDVAWYDDNSGNSTHPVKCKRANELGLYDMSGNVFEWCHDWFGTYTSLEQTNPLGPQTGKYRVVRGCSFDTFANVAYRVTYRSFQVFRPISRGPFLGFRLVLSFH